MKKKSIGMLSLSAALSLSLLAPNVSAAGSTMQVSSESKSVENTTINNVISKEELIKKINKLFPGKFDFLTASDYHLNTGHRFQKDDNTVRYHLHFSKEVGGKHIHGEFGFLGEDYQLYQYYYRPADEADALFPPKVSKDEAQKIAETFLEKISLGLQEYKLDETNDHYYRPNQTLTEPIRYNFNYMRVKNGVPVSNQNIHISVLGNGEVINFNGPYFDEKEFVYENTKNAKSVHEVLNQVKRDFNMNLHYLVDYDYKTQKSNVRLTYLPLQSVTGIHAITGKWMIQNSVVESLPTSREVSMLVDQPLPKNKSAFTLNDAKARAEKLLAVEDIEGLRLQIESIEERKDYLGKEVISVQFMYFMGNSGTGSSLEFDKETGDVLRFHNHSTDLLRDYGKIKEPATTISYEDALNKAIQYAKEFAPSSLHLFAYPQIEAQTGRNGYNLTFPRIKDGIVVSNENLSVGIGLDGSLNSLHVNLYHIDQWPNAEKVVSSEVAKQEFLDKIRLELNYLKDFSNEESKPDNKNYNLVYSLKYLENYQFINAITGEWENYYNPEVESNKPTVSNHWAEEELNFMINAGIIKVDKEASFNPDAVTTKGEALEVMMKSLTRFYDHHYGREDKNTHTFDNIKPEHPLFEIVERAVSFGILDKSDKQFALDEALTRQDLAAWYIRAVGLEKAAKHHSLYNLNFNDASGVKEKNKGYVALANALGLLTASNQSFSPDQNVTYSQLAVSSFRLAKLVYNDERLNRY